MWKICNYKHNISYWLIILGCKSPISNFRGVEQNVPVQRRTKSPAYSSNSFKHRVGSGIERMHKTDSESFVIYCQLYYIIIILYLHHAVNIYCPIIIIIITITNCHSHMQNQIINSGSRLAGRQSNV